MLFNNRIQQTNLLTSPYLQGNILFHPEQITNLPTTDNQSVIYSPVLNLVKRTSLVNNKCSIIPGLETQNNITKICVDPSGTVLIAVDIVGYAIVYNLKGNFVIAEFNFKGFVQDIGYSPDGKLVYVLTGQGFTVYESPGYWRNFQPFMLIKKYKNRHTGKIYAAKFTPDSRFLVTWGQDNIIHINNLFPIEGYLPISLEVHRYKILGVAFVYNPQNSIKYFYSVDSGSNIYLWKWIDQEQLTDAYKNRKQMLQRRRKNRKGTQTQAQDILVKKLKRQDEYSDDNQQNKEETYHMNQLYSQFEKQVIKGRFILSKKLIITQPGSYLKRFQYNSNTGFLAAAYSSGKFSIYKLQEEQLNQVQTLSIGSYKISSLCVNDSCTWLALGIKSTGQLIVWEWKSQSYIFKQKGLIYDSVALATFKNGGKFIATGTTQGEVKLWQQSSGFCVATFAEHSSSVTDIKFSNANTLFSCGLDGNVHAYDAVKYKKFRTYRADVNCQFNCLAVQESGQIVIAGSFDPYQVFAWNVQTANILQIIKGHQGPISSLQISGDHLVTGSWDRTLKIHELYARKLNVETLQHSSQVTALALHPDGKKIAVATIKGEIYLWDLDNSILLGIIQAEMKGGRSYFSKISAQNDTNSKYLKSIVFTTCGKYLIGGGKSKYLNIYDIEHRILLKRIPITKNRDIQGTLQKLNSSYIKQGQSTYQMMLQEQEQNLSDDDQQFNNFNHKLPGSKKIDISEIRKKLEVEVKKIVLLSSVDIAVCTSFGVLLFSSNPFTRRQIFNPYQLVPNMSPLMIKQLLQQKEYSAAIIGTLTLNLPILPVLNLIPSSQTTRKQIISELNEEIAELLLKQMASHSLAGSSNNSKRGNGLNFKQCLWLENILTTFPQIKIEGNLRAAMQNMLQQSLLLERIKYKLKASKLMSLQ